MRLYFRLGPGPRELSAEVRSSLASRFRIEPDIISRARLLVKAGKKGCRDIRVYDPAVVTLTIGAVKKYDDLTIHKHAILFEGRIEKDGSVYLADRRPPKTVTRRPSRPPTPSPKPDQAT
ncbi:MAG: hypothetical protein HYU30_07540 [Chloroflexi bacterium]|nr:hypothetical protein [Chloroflexota bacterium]